jgi:CheY-like chemotaxis protein
MGNEARVMTTKKALIVDDSKLAQFLLKKMLGRHELEVDTIDSAEEALGYLSHKKPDVIFMDHTMPGMNGLQALKVIKDNPNTATIPVMMYTSQNDGMYMSQARALGAVDILPKQLKPVELAQVLKKLHLIDDLRVDETTALRQEIHQFPANETSSGTLEAEELSNLLRDAESALEKETLKQFVHQKLDKQDQRFARILQQINQSLKALNDKENNSKLETESSLPARHSSVLWLALLMLVTIVFGLLYYDLQQALSSIQQNAYASSNASSNANSNAVNSLKPVKPAIIAQPLTSNDNQHDVLLLALESSVNSSGNIPMEESLFGERSLQKLVNLIAPLNVIKFSGNLQVIAHTGNFCLKSNANGEFSIPDAKTPISECQIIEPTTTIEQMMTAEFRSFITDINNDESANFYISLVARDGSEPLTSYPDIANAMTAGTWNAIAQQNHRVEFVFSTAQ